MSVVKFQTRASMKKQSTPFEQAKARMQARLGVTVEEFFGDGGQRTQESQSKIDRALRKQTMRSMSTFN